MKVDEVLDRLEAWICRAGPGGGDGAGECGGGQAERLALALCAGLAELFEGRGAGGVGRRLWGGRWWR